MVAPHVLMHERRHCMQAGQHDGQIGLDLMTKPLVPHVVFGIFNLAWPNIAFWALVIIVFAVATRARMPKFMESDASSRKGRTDDESR